jgi:signal transduction histidine kinase
MIELPNARAMRWLFLQTAALILAAAVTTLLWPLPPAPAWCLAWGSALCFGLVLALIAHRAARIVRAFTRAGTELERNRHELLTAWQERTRDAQAVSATIAHELKNPLASIKGLVELVAPRAEDERARKRYGVILHEIARMQTTIDEYLDYARPIHVLDVAETRLERVAVEVVALLEARARSHDVRLEVVGRATIVGDARRLREALLNLIANALQACGADDRVRVEIQETTLGARLVIADSGRGMNAAELAQVGTAYYTTRAGGTGLGVVLSRAVIEQHGGSLDYASAKGQGTRVTVELPSIPVVTQPVSVRSADRARRLVS